MNEVFLNLKIEIEIRPEMEMLFMRLKFNDHFFNYFGWSRIHCLRISSRLSSNCDIALLIPSEFILKRYVYTEMTLALNVKIFVWRSGPMVQIIN